MKYGIIVDTPNENTQDEFTWALYDELTHHEKNPNIKFVSPGLITIDGKDSKYDSPVEIILEVQRFLKDRQVHSEEFASFDLVKMDQLGDLKQLIDDNANAYKQKDDDHKIEDLLSDLADSFRNKYIYLIDKGDYTPLLNKLEEDSIDDDHYDPNEDYSVESFCVFRDEEKNIDVSVESIDSVWEFFDRDGFRAYKCVPVCFRVKAEHLDSDKYVTRVLWGKDPLEWLKRLNDRLKAK